MSNTTPARILDTVTRAEQFLNRLNRALPEVGLRYDDVRVNVTAIHNSRTVVPHDEPLDLAGAALVVRRQGQLAIETGSTLSLSLIPLFAAVNFTDAD